MNCLKCESLNRVFGLRFAHYTEARSAAFYRVSTELAAKTQVDMERAKVDLQEHQAVCSFAVPLASNPWTPHGQAKSGMLDLIQVGRR
jgi:hypothetical protein